MVARVGERGREVGEFLEHGLGPAGRANAASVVAEGLASRAAYADGRIVLTRRGRLLADAVTRALTE